MRERLEVVLKRFESPDETRTFEKGRFELVRLGGMTLGRATYEPGWRPRHLSHRSPLLSGPVPMGLAESRSATAT
jgi:hypothetical protein